MDRIKEIDYDLDVAREFIPEHARYHLAKSLSLLPEEIVDFVVKNLIFISPEDYRYIKLDHWIFKNRLGIISLCPELWKEEPLEMAYIIAHEIAHAIKDDTIDMEMEKNLSLEEGEDVEIRADRLAVEWLSQHYEERELRKLCRYWKEGT